jgi:hypothetical protein
MTRLFCHFERSEKSPGEWGNLAWGDPSLRSG